MANFDKKIPILAIVGATASGKSAVAMELAKRRNGEIVSCDSMQIYRRMDIGTAKPSTEDRLAVPHHLIDVSDPSRPFSCADYVALAKDAIEEIYARGKLPIVCGGTGLYLDALLRGGGFSEETAVDPTLRQSLFDYAAEHGNRALHERLRAVDPESAEATHENNVKRVVRALEIYESSGVTKTEMDRRSRVFESPYRAAVIGLHYPDRALLYRRIDRRVDEMLEQGLLEETERLCNEGVFESNTTAAQAIGYKELLQHLNGEQALTDAIANLKQATRRYAKRQITWFGAKEYVHTIDVFESSTADELADKTWCIAAPILQESEVDA